MQINDKKQAETRKSNLPLSPHLWSYSWNSGSIMSILGRFAALWVQIYLDVFGAASYWIVRHNLFSSFWPVFFAIGLFAGPTLFRFLYLIRYPAYKAGIFDVCSKSSLPILIASVALSIIWGLWTAYFISMRVAHSHLVFPSLLFGHKILLLAILPSMIFLSWMVINPPQGKKFSKFASRLLSAEIIAYGSSTLICAMMILSMRYNCHKLMLLNYVLMLAVLPLLAWTSSAHCLIVMQDYVQPEGRAVLFSAFFTRLNMLAAILMILSFCFH